MTRRRHAKYWRRAARLQALAALAVGAATLALAGLAASTDFPRGLIVLACVALALFAGLFGLVHRGLVRVLGLVLSVALAGGSVGILTGRADVLAMLVVVGLLLTLIAASGAFRVRVPLPLAPRPQRPVLFYNPRSGGGKAERLALAAEATARGIEPCELTPGKDLQELVRDAVSRGADALAMPVGDGSQAIVAALAAEHSLPYACVPAGTRNHFALDLGVDRDDVVGVLDALVDGAERNRESRCAGPTRTARSSRVKGSSSSRTTATGWASSQGRKRECGRTSRRGCLASSLSASEPLHVPTARCRGDNCVSGQPGRSPWTRAGVLQRASTVRPPIWSRR